MIDFLFFNNDAASFIKVLFKIKLKTTWKIPFEKNIEQNSLAWKNHIYYSIYYICRISYVLSAEHRTEQKRTQNKKILELEQK